MTWAKKRKLRSKQRGRRVTRVGWKCRDAVRSQKPTVRRTRTCVGPSTCSTTRESGSCMQISVRRCRWIHSHVLHGPHLYLTRFIMEYVELRPHNKYILKKQPFNWISNKTTTTVPPFIEIPSVFFAVDFNATVYIRSMCEKKKTCDP